jgi:glycogen operon protein
VVFNHTAEGNELGPTLCFRGIDNSIYYLLTENPRYYQNYTGVGNTFNANQPIVQDLVIDCLRYWVQEMHVDGFRFDLATSLSRDRWGNLSGDPALPVRISEDPVLRTAKIIAEPWDIGGYQVGHFPGGRWAEWNDKYRDEIRKYWRGDLGLVGGLATRLAGSADLYHASGRSPSHSINFVAAHDGFTLNDLVSYNWKHNEDNGEHNRDGHDNNLSYNYGYEGPSKKPELEALRSRQVKNFLATLLLSQGTPMINGGDEFRRTQRGNNNAYSQDNEISWYDWSFLEKYADVYRFARAAIALRQAHPVFRRAVFFTGLDVDGDQFEDVRWCNADGSFATWNHEDKALMCVLDGSKKETRAQIDDVDVLMMFNSDTGPRQFYLPPSPGGSPWRLAIDTGQPSPEDAYFPGEEIELEPDIVYQVKSRAMVVLIAKAGAQ